MRTVGMAFGSLALAALVCAPSAGAQGVATARVQVTLEVASRTSLRVSSDVLRFDVPEGAAEATAAIDFTAAARMPGGAGVVLSVEPLRAIDGPGGAADVETALSFAGDGPGLLAGTLAPHDTAVVGRWTGSGRRDGRVVFTLRARAAGRYAVPVRFVLSAP
jgi:hypothetical protein